MVFLPAWIENLFNEVDEVEEEKIREAEAEAQATRLEELARLNAEKAKEQAQQKTREMQKQALKVICSTMNKKSRAARRRK